MDKDRAAFMSSATALRAANIRALFVLLRRLLARIQGLPITLSGKKKKHWELQFPSGRLPTSIKRNKGSHLSLKGIRMLNSPP